jgi:Flp pilus assembly protein TadB
VERDDSSSEEELPPELEALLRAGPPGDPGLPGDRPTQLPDSLEARALADEHAEIRRMVDAGARTPAELRAIAERLRAHRQREDALWRTAVKPTLRRSGFDSTPARRNLLVGSAVIGCVLLVVLAAALGNVLVVLAPLVAVLVVAYVLGSRSDRDGEP